MRYRKTVKGTFISRPNRFIAKVQVEGKTETVHVKNTGRCRELLIPGCTVILEDFRGTDAASSRKTMFDLVAVYKTLDGDNPLCKLQTGTAPQTCTAPQTEKIPNQTILINMDSQAPNKVVMEWLSSLPKEKSYDLVKPEYTYGNSRVDFYMEKGPQKYLMEVKGCTLEKNGTGYFPDAPTERGVKHLNELAQATLHGFKCIIAFVIQVPGVKEVRPNTETHPQFTEALEHAKSCGVEVLFLQCVVEEDSLIVS